MDRATFNAPDILFLNTWDSAERKFMGPLLRDLRAAGYTRYVEPFSAAMVMPTVAREFGWEPAQMVTSDVSLFAAIAGYACSGRDLQELEVKLDGSLIEIAGLPPETQAAMLLWYQLVARMEKRAAEVDYWREMVADLYFRRHAHMATIERDVKTMIERLGGLEFRLESIWRTLGIDLEGDDLLNDPHAVVVCNPPTYKGGYEKFFDTAGRLTWKEVPYEVWDPEPHQSQLAESMRHVKALCLVQQQARPRACAGDPVYARHLSPGQYVYVWSNRPAEVLELTGGPRVVPRAKGDMVPYDAPPVEPDTELLPDSQVRVVAVPQGVAMHYKQRWLHRLAGAEGAYNWLVLVDGRVAGVGGYSFKAIQTPYPGVDAKIWAGAIIMRFALGAPHDLRLTRLVTRIALQRETLLLVAKTLPSVMLMAAGADKIVTTEYTRHPEAKSLRGLMKLADRSKAKPDGFKLVYWADLGDVTAQEAYEAWWADEQRYLAKRQKKEATA